MSPRAAKRPRAIQAASGGELEDAARPPASAEPRVATAFAPPVGRTPRHRQQSVGAAPTGRLSAAAIRPATVRPADPFPPDLEALSHPQISWFLDESPTWFALQQEFRRRLGLPDALLVAHDPSATFILEAARVDLPRYFLQGAKSCALAVAEPSNLPRTWQKHPERIIPPNAEAIAKRLDETRAASNKRVSWVVVQTAGLSGRKLNAIRDWAREKMILVCLVVRAEHLSRKTCTTEPDMLAVVSGHQYGAALIQPKPILQEIPPELLRGTDVLAARDESSIAGVLERAGAPPHAIRLRDGRMFQYHPNTQLFLRGTNSQNHIAQTQFLGELTGRWHKVTPPEPDDCWSLFHSGWGLNPGQRIVQTYNGPEAMKLLRTNKTRDQWFGTLSRVASEAVEAEVRCIDITQTGGELFHRVFSRGIDEAGRLCQIGELYGGNCGKGATLNRTGKPRRAEGRGEHVLRVNAERTFSSPPQGASSMTTAEAAMCAQLEREHARSPIRTVAMEIIDGATGAFYSPAFYRWVRDFTRDQGITLVYDEILSGCFRTGPFCAYMHIGPDIEPDVILIGKYSGTAVAFAFDKKAPVPPSPFDPNPSTLGTMAIPPYCLMRWGLDHGPEIAANIARVRRTLRRRLPAESIQGAGMLLTVPPGALPREAQLISDRFDARDRLLPPLTTSDTDLRTAFNPEK